RGGRGAHGHGDHPEGDGKAAGAVPRGARRVVDQGPADHAKSGHAVRDGLEHQRRASGGRVDAEGEHADPREAERPGHEVDRPIHGSSVACPATGRIRPRADAWSDFTRPTSTARVMPYVTARSDSRTAVPGE